MKSKGKVRPYPKGRPVDAGALEEVRVLLGDEPRRRDLLIEHLHKINDRYGHLSAAHLAALAQEMALSQTEVYEVATFYHHFEVVKEGEAPPPSLTVRVCDSIACELAGSDALLEKLPSILGKDVRVVHAPCVGRCEVAPVAVVGQNPVGHATVDTVKKAVEEKQVLCAETRYIDFAAYKKGGGYKLISDCLDGKHTREALTKIMEDSGLRGLGGAGFPVGRKWRSVAAEPEPRLMAVNIDEGEPGTFKDRWYLERDPHRFRRARCRRFS
jgi:NADH:ubiquinone oxidoreductase subunit E